MKWLLLPMTIALFWIFAVALRASVQPGSVATSAVVRRVMAMPRWALFALVVASAGLALLCFHQSLRAFHISRVQTASTLLIAVALVAALHLMVRYRAPRWTFLLPLLLALMPQLAAGWATQWHGFMHASIVYEIFEHGMPPQNPLFAGDALLYPYGHHVLIAWLMRWVPITPVQAFIVTDFLALAIYAWLIERAASMLSDDWMTRVLIVMFAVLGPSVFVQSPLSDLLGSGGLGLRIEWRYVPLSKFTGINNNQVGLVFCVLGLWGLLAVTSGRRNGFAGYLALAIALLGAGLIYPASWLGLAACVMATAGLLALLHARYRTAAALAVIATSVTLVALPFLLSITAGKAGTSALRLTFEGAHLLRNATDLLVFFSLSVPLLWVCRAAIRNAVSEYPLAWTALAGCVIASVSEFLLVSVPDHAEYKFLHMAVLALSIPLGLSVRELSRNRPLAAFAVMILVALPFAAPFNSVLVGEVVADPVFSDGRNTRHRNADQDALYTWLAANTPRDAVFIDSYLALPALARRRLLVGLDLRRDAGLLKGSTGTMHDGWLISAEEFLTENTGVDPGHYQHLRATALRLLTPGPAGPVSEDIAALVRASRGQPLYVVARDTLTRERLSSSPQFREVFAGKAAAVFKVQS